jgi:hypothetical protein
MSLSKSEAIAQVNARINEMDLDWPTKPKQVVFEELTQETDEGWLFFYAIPEDMRMLERDPEPQDNPPWMVDRETGELTLSDNGVQPTRPVDS